MNGETNCSVLWFSDNNACNNKLYFEKINEMTKQTKVTDDFIRRGKIGGYKDEMTNETIEKFDKWIAEEGQLKTGFQRIKKWKKFVKF